MTRPLKGFRTLAGAGAAGLSLAAGFLLVFRLATPDTVGGLRTIDLLGMVALFVLPPLAAWAFAFDRRAAVTESAFPGPALDETAFDESGPSPADAGAPGLPASTLEAKPTGFSRREIAVSPAAERDSVPGRATEHHRRRQPDPARREHAPSRR